jgi:CRP/FNR family transcriptional regulator, cyclic AMP receptor protein
MAQNTIRHSIENCLRCKLRTQEFFCQMDGAALKDFDSIKSLSMYPADYVLFVEKESARGVFVLCQGRVKLSICSSQGRTFLLRIANPGELLGLTAAVGGFPYEFTAETLGPSQIAFVRREDFLRFVKQHPNNCQNLLAQIESSCQGVREQLRIVGLSSIPKRIARVLLDWSDQPGCRQKLDRWIPLPLTHEEIGEFVGSTRETVTRTLGDFEQRRLISAKRTSVVIRNRRALERIAAS